jgi:hypothetical protein
MDLPLMVRAHSHGLSVTALAIPWPSAWDQSLEQESHPSSGAEGYGILSLLRFMLRLRQVHHPPLSNACRTNQSPGGKQSATQLNCRADKLAEQYLTDFPNIDRTRAPLLPTAGSQLHLTKGTITYKLKLDLTHARSVPPSKESSVTNTPGWSTNSMTLTGHPMVWLFKGWPNTERPWFSTYTTGYQWANASTCTTPSIPIGATPAAPKKTQWWRTQCTFANALPPAGWSGELRPSVTCQESFCKLAIQLLLSRNSC